MTDSRPTLPAGAAPGHVVPAGAAPGHAVPAGPAPGPLAGVRVLDFSSVVMGPYATQVLGDLGADVITVEGAKPDANRTMGRAPHPQFSGASLNLLRNKRNVLLDIKQPAGRDALLRVAATCDVLVTNVRPAGLRRARLTYEDVAAVRPDIVYCEAHGFATGSDREDDPAYDDIIQAASGLADAARRATGTPALSATLLADKLCGLTIVYAVTAALYRRAVTGEGEHIEVPMRDTAVAWALVEHGADAVPQPAAHPAGYARILNPQRRPQPTTNGWLQVMPYAKAHFDALFVAGGRAELVTDERAATTRDRVINAEYLYGEIGAILATRSTEEWLAFCREHSIPASAVASLDDLVAALPDAEHPVVGRYKEVPPPVRFSHAPQGIRRPAPLMGQHTDEVLAEAGYSAAEVAELRRLGAVPEPALEG